MTKQEKILEGIYKILRRHVKASLVVGEYTDGITKLVSVEVAFYLHSQGVVIKVDRELPVELSIEVRTEELVDGSKRVYWVLPTSILAGYVAVEPLVKE